MDKLHFDPEAVLMDDLDVFETIAGCEFESVIGGATASASSRKVMMGVYYLVMRQNDPEFTADSLKKVTLGRVAAVAEAFEAMKPDPTEGAVAP